MSATRTAGERLWRWPIVIGVVTATGLVSALIADGPWDVVSWLALGLPVAVSACCAWRPERAG